MPLNVLPRLNLIPLFLSVQIRAHEHKKYILFYMLVYACRTMLHCVLGLMLSLSAKHGKLGFVFGPKCSYE